MKVECVIVFVLSLQNLQVYCQNVLDNYPTVESIVGQTAELPCNTTSENEGDTVSVLAWYKNFSATSIYSRDLRDMAGGDADAASGDPRYSVIDNETASTLLIRNVRPADAGVYSCHVDFQNSPSQKTVLQLNVIEPPQHMWVMHANGSKVATAAHRRPNATETAGPYFIGDMLHMFCVSFGGRPRPSIQWFFDGILLKTNSTPLSEQRARSDFVLGPLTRDHRRKTISCQISNNPYSQPLSVDVTIDMILPPELVVVRRPDVPDGSGTAPVRAGDELQLQCRVLGAYPTPEVVWTINDELVPLEQNVTELEQGVVVSASTLSISRAHDESAVSCCAVTPAPSPRLLDQSCAPPHPLTVYYAPILAIASNAEVDNGTVSVLKGAWLTLNCSLLANPKPFELIWYHGDTVVTRDSGQAGSLLQPSLEIASVAETDAGEYLCAASNAEGSTTSTPVVLQVLYPPYCKDQSPLEFGVPENEPLNITCNMKGNPAPSSYRWVVVHEAVNASTLRSDSEYVTKDTVNNVLSYTRGNDTVITTILCWGINDAMTLLSAVVDVPCTIWVTDEMPPKPPGNCRAKKTDKDIMVTCDKGHNGGLPQKFILTIKELDTDQELISIMNLEPNFLVQEPSHENYKFHIVATNDKGNSQTIVIQKDDIVGDPEATVSVGNTVADITTLALSLCGGVALVALCACGLVLCAHAHASVDDSDGEKHPPLTAYNTDESNCGECDDDSDYNLRQTDSLRRAINRCPSRTYAIRRTSSFHSPRCLNDDSETFNDRTDQSSEGARYPPSCRVHSMQNICRKRDVVDACEHMPLHLPQEHNYTVHKPINTFYTMPRSIRQKISKECIEEPSEITQNSDTISLPPPPEDFLGYRVPTRIRDLPTKSTPTYSTIRKFPRKETSPFNNVVISSLNTVGLPTTSSGAHNSLYSYPGENQQQVNDKNPFDD